MLGVELENEDLDDDEYNVAIKLNKTTFNINVDKAMDVASHVQSKRSLVFHINQGSGSKWKIDSNSTFWKNIDSNS